ncbi:MAG: efflux RND transporter periplasmic adaptor subunit [Sphingobacteriales bacterium]
MKKIITALALSATLVSCGQKEKTFVTSTRDENRTTVKVANVSTEEIRDSIKVDGLLATENEAKLSFKTGGVIDRIYVKEGEFVKKGQLLAALKVTEVNSQLDQAKLAVEKTQRDYERATNLYRDSVVTLEQMQNAKTAFEVAKRVLDAIAFDQQYAYIKAEADGFVTAKSSNEGEVTAPGIPVLTVDEASGSDDFLLRVGVTDEQWALIGTGQKATIELDAFAGKTFTGFVYRKSRSADKSGGSFQVDLKVNFDSETPAVGMFGKAVIAPGKPVKEFTIPFEALIQVNGQRAQVYVAKDDHSLKRIDVLIGTFNDKSVIVRSGLKEGDAVIVSNEAFLNENSKIAIAK